MQENTESNQISAEGFGIEQPDLLGEQIKILQEKIHNEEKRTNHGNSWLECFSTQIMRTKSELIKNRDNLTSDATDKINERISGFERTFANLLSKEDGGKNVILAKETKNDLLRQLGKIYVEIKLPKKEGLH